MKICFDLRALQIGHENRGIGMFVKSLLEHLPAESDNEYIVYAFDKGDPIKDLNIDVKFKYDLVTTKTIKTSVEKPKDFIGMLKLINHRFSDLKRLRPDVFVQFDFNLGLPNWRGTKKIVIGYDLIPLIMRNEYMPSPRFAWNHTLGKKARLKTSLRAAYYRIKYRLSYRTYKKADNIVCISEATARSFKELLGIPEAHLSVAPLAPVIPDAKPNFSVADKINKPFIFYVGGTDSRKNIQDIIFAFNIARSRGLDIGLVLAGNEFNKIEDLPSVEGRNAILESPYKHDITLAGFITAEQKIGLYKKALAFVFCSSYEGFGLPVVEAMAMGCPVISYNNSSIPEAAGDAVMMIKSNDYVEVANQLINLQSENLRQNLIEKGLSQSRKFSWKKHVDKFIAIIKE